MVGQADSWPEKGLLAGKGLRVTMMRWVDQADSWPEKRTLGREKRTLGRKKTQNNYDEMGLIRPILGWQRTLGQKNDTE